MPPFQQVLETGCPLHNTFSTFASTKWPQRLSSERLAVDEGAVTKDDTETQPHKPFSCLLSKSRHMDLMNSVPQEVSFEQETHLPSVTRFISIIASQRYITENCTSVSGHITGYLLFINRVFGLNTSSLASAFNEQIHSYLYIAPITWYLRRSCIEQKTNFPYTHDLNIKHFRAQ